MKRIPMYKLQIVGASTEQPVVFDPGGTYEADLVALFVREIGQDYHGVLRTHAQVMRSVEAGIQRALYRFKEGVTLR